MWIMESENPNNYQRDKAQQKPNQKIINNFIMWMKFIKFNLFLQHILYSISLLAALLCNHLISRVFYYNTYYCSYYAKECINNIINNCISMKTHTVFLLHN